MKNSFLVFSPLLWLSTFCSAQNKITAGLQTKAGLSNYRMQEDGTRNQNLTAFGGGLYVDLPVSRSFSVRPQLGWLRKGYQQDSQAGTGGQFATTTNTKAAHDYLFLDLTLVYRARIDKAWRPFIQVGARGGMLIYTQFKETTPAKQNIYHPDLAFFRRLTVGGLISIGMEWKRFSFGIEANRDISTFMPIPEIPLFESVRPRFGWYGVNLSYQLRSF